MNPDMPHSGWTAPVAMTGLDNPALFTDLYELTMLQAYFHET